MINIYKNIKKKSEANSNFNLESRMKEKRINIQYTSGKEDKILLLWTSAIILITECFKY